MDFSQLPGLNALLNGMGAVFLTAGYIFILSGARDRHRNCMLGACFCSALFLISYLIYHFQVGSVPYSGLGPKRLIYFTILVSHILLALVMVPLVGLTLVRALKKEFSRHRQIARRTLPLWLYVSVTGVIIYLMLYGL
jgi:uncharacterized membrane protein YozB (DUF420 family)